MSNEPMKLNRAQRRALRRATGVSGEEIFEIPETQVDMPDKYPKCMDPIYKWMRDALMNPGKSPKIPLLGAVQKTRHKVESVRDRLSVVADDIDVGGQPDDAVATAIRDLVKEL